MPYAISWFLVLMLLAIWSLAAWALHAVAAWSTTGIGQLVDQAQAWEQVVLPAWVAVWLPSEWMDAIRASTAVVLPWFQSVLSDLPAVAHWFGPLAWSLWGVGTVVLLAGGGALHALIASMRRATHR